MTQPHIKYFCVSLLKEQDKAQFININIVSV